jgi:signal transduction histidine kinase
MTSRDGSPPRRHDLQVTTLSAAAAARSGDHPPLRRVALAAVIGVWGLLLAALVFEALLSGADLLAEIARGLSLYGYVALVAYGTLGTVLVWLRPRNRLGWVALAVAAAHGLSFATGTYGIVAGERGWPGAGETTWVGSWIWVVGYWGVPTFLLMLFPDGRLPSRRWLPLAWAAAIGLLLSLLGWATLPYADRDVPMDPDILQPLVLPFAETLMSVGGLLGIASTLGALASLVVRHRRAAGVERLQVRWALLGGAATTLLLAAGFAAGTGTAGNALLALAMVPLAAAVAVGVLRHRLWDVDLVINRSLVYGVLSLGVLGTYVATVTLLGGLLGRGTGAPLVATALVAIGVNPLRVRLQRWANEALYGQRDDPHTALRRLVERLDATDGSGTALDEAAETVRRAVRADHVAIEVDDVVRSEAGRTRRDVEGPVTVPLLVRGERVGTLLVAMPRSDALEPGERELLDDLAHRVAIAVHTERLTSDLQESRRRLVEAREEERRRIRRDLHDELGPTLASVAMRIEQASQADAGPAALDGLPERVREAVRSVRGLVDDLRPAALDELGLAVAVRARVRHFEEGGLHVDVEIDEDLGPLSAAVDVAAYRIVSEALANVGRHASAARCRVLVTRRGDEILLEVSDDGTGLPAVPRAGVGLRSMRDRAAEVGGSCLVESTPGSGSTVRAVLPAVRT